ncbi:MAG: patatin-like phospholipase family protein [Eubacteriales bacterium]|nr:patatin-like phospholipase family protein [Eubacteriales bacterium]
MKFGLVLEGGGSKGSYHIGACKALEEMGIKFSCVAGTSVGALNGALIVQNEIDKAYSLWHDIQPSMVINFSEDDASEDENSSKESKSKFGTLKKLQRIIKERGIDINPLIELVNINLDEEKIRKSDIEFGLVAVDLTDRKPLELYKEDIPEGKLADYILASASLPGFKLKYIDGKIFMDGGLYNTLPINMVKNKGIKDIIVIRTFGYGRIRKIDTTGLNIIEISPVENLGPILDFRSDLARKNLKMGYFDAVKAIKKLKGTRYYIEPVNDEGFFLKHLMKLSDDKIKKVAGIFGVKGVGGKRGLFEIIIPHIADLAGIPKTSSYEEVTIEVLERLADALNIERFRIYTIKEFISTVLDEYENSKDKLKVNYFKEDNIKEDSIKEAIPKLILKRDKQAKDKLISLVAVELLKGIKADFEVGIPAVVNVDSGEIVS